jgi:prevent-host-death family protein
MTDSTRERRRARGATVTATEAAKNFGELVDRVREAGIEYVIEKKGRPIARIASVSSRRCTIVDLARWFEGRRAAVDDEYAAAVKAHTRASNRPRVPVARWRP